MLGDTCSAVDDTCLASDSSSTDKVLTWRPWRRCESDACVAIRELIFDDWNSGNQPTKLKLSSADFKVHLHNGHLQAMHDLANHLTYGECPHITFFGHVHDLVSHVYNETPSILSVCQESVASVMQEFESEFEIEVSWHPYGKGWGTAPSSDCAYFRLLQRLQGAVCDGLSLEGILLEELPSQSFHCSMHVSDEAESLKVWNRVLVEQGPWRYF